MKPLHLGIDLGSMGLRVAYATEGSGVADFEIRSADGDGWLRCERSASHRVGVFFPSLKTKLGATAGHDGGPAPSETLITALARAKHDVEERAGRPVAQAVICVPTFYPTSQRTAVHDAVLAAGFGAAHLINDSVSAVTAHTAGRTSPATVLVFGAGYHGFELGLARVVKGHIRVLAYEGGSVAGADLDQLVLEGVMRAAKDWGLGERQWDPTHWLRVRAAAQTVKEQLGTADQVAFPLGALLRSGTAMQVNVQRQDFEEVVRDAFLPAVRLVDALLRQADMSRTELDVVVLTGGTARIPALQSLVTDAVGRPPIVAAPTALAVGAALHAAGLGAEATPALFDAERFADPREDELPDPNSVALRATLSVTEGNPPASAAFPALVIVPAIPAASGPDMLSPGSLTRHVSQLVSAGEVERARTELRELIREAQATLDDLPDSRKPAVLSPASPAYRSQLALSTARSCIERGQFAMAVSESHYAWKLGPGDPDVLDKMIDIHCQAAHPNSAPEQYDDAIRWLLCALSHDESNARIRAQLAERHYHQAQELHRRREAKQALRAVESCFGWDPAHPGAIELQRILTAE